MQNDTQENKNLLTIGESSEYLGVSIDTLRRWEKKGRIEPLRSPGGHRYYSKDSLDNLFGKRYTRDEKTMRSKGPYKDEGDEVKINGKEREDNSQKDLADSKNSPDPIFNFEESVIAARYVSKDTVEPSSYSQETVERPARQVRIPEPTRVSVIRRDAFLTPEEAYYRQQSLSILNPPQNAQTNPPTPLIQAPINTPAFSHPTSQSNFPSQMPSIKQAPSIKDQILNDKNLIIYASLAIGIILLSLGGYFAWLSSQRVLSPIP